MTQDDRITSCDRIEPRWFCEMMPVQTFRRFGSLWGAPTIPFFGFPKPSDVADIYDSGEGYPDDTPGDP